MTAVMRALSEHECRRRLGTAGVGRVAITMAAMPAILPVNYALLGDDIIFCTNEGSTLAAAARDAVVAFEIDGVDSLGHGGWSVQAVGVARHVTDEAELARIRGLPLRSWAAIDRPVYIRVATRVVSGRELTQVPAAHRPATDDALTP